MQNRNAENTNSIRYKSWKMSGIGEKPGLVIVDDAGKTVNRNPTEDELKSLKRFPEKDGRSRYRGKYKYSTKEELIDYLRRFYEKYGRPPITEDFTNNPEYPNYQTYIKRFGSWSNTLKLVGLDIESMTEQGILKTNDQKARFAETIIIRHFKTHLTDLAGENKNNPCDGICPNGKMYDVKSSGLHNGVYYKFGTNNKHKEEIEIYYFLAFNSDWTKLEYGWRVPGEIVEKDSFYVGLNPSYEFNIENMEEYDITDKFKDLDILY